ncbi:hypothetical protein SISNIDRAFT_484923 [Sistotremastrum niveocremeum HHB9708]|uniref:E3 ubiquitin protein ligase n=1 Tax=Sistotremastrum niveocremeum HHB9708 TaxID=1314777 RepID=A0A164V9Z0_9AGAM|nr:hypothetical protein SISNIDRAFT_484923 [Sistotremastrum niveocremeum HHB9708]
MDVQRKRPSEEVDPSAHPAKKRALASPSDSPVHLNGAEANGVDEALDGDKLERFRKDAIFRRMKYYARECSRAQAQAEELEQMRKQYHANVAAIEACWSQLIQQLRARVNTERLPSEVPSTSLYDLALRTDGVQSTELSEALKDRSRLTQELIDLTQDTSAPPLAPDVAELKSRTTSLEAEVALLREELALSRSNLEHSESRGQKCMEELVLAQSRLDRAESEVVGKGKTSSRPEEASPVEPTVPKESETAPEESRRLGAERLEAQLLAHPLAPYEMSNAPALLEYRRTRISQLELTQKKQNEALIALRRQLADPTMAVISGSMIYKTLGQEAIKYKTLYEGLLGSQAELQSELAELTTARNDFQREFASADAAIIEELKNQLTARNNDLIRLRESRDALEAEVKERKGASSAPSATGLLQQAKIHSASRQERIKSLESEISSLKLRTAGNAQDEDYCHFLLRNNESGTNFVDYMKKTLASTQNRLQVLEAAVEESMNDPDGFLKREVELRERLSATETELAKLKSVFSDPEIHDLAQQIQSLTERLKTAQLANEAKEKEVGDLQRSLDQLAAAWETLDNQMNNKIFDATAMHEKLKKSDTERRKTADKFFAVSRVKDQLEHEQKAQTRVVEKQRELLEKQKELLDTLRKEMDSHKLIIGPYEASFQNHNQRFEKILGEKEALELLIAQLKKEADIKLEAYNSLNDSLHKEQIETRELNEKLIEVKEELERERLLQKSTRPANTSAREADLEIQLKDCMTLLKCSTCKLAMRSHLLQKCLHTFCKSCIDARVSTRQRKCPACQMAFAQSEVQPLYLQ